MANITDYLYRIQDLTNTNLKILTAINEAFSTKKEHLSVMIGATRYIIPSYIALENKIDQLQSDVENITSIPKTGEAAITFDGNTQKIQLLGYSNSPEEQHLDAVTTFKSDKTKIFKDFMTPSPYIRLNLSNVTNHTKTVNIKKVTLKNSQLIGGAQEMQKDGIMAWSDMAHLLYGYEADVDYVEYDTIKRMPVKDNVPEGTYTVRRVNRQWIDDNFEEHYELEFNEDLTYTSMNGTIEFDIEVGDYLVTNDDTVKLLVEEVHSPVKTVVVKVLYGAYAEIHDITQGDDRCKLRYYKHNDYTPYKYIDVPLEEDRYVCVFAAAVNDQMNIQAPWGEGIYLDTDTLTINLNGTIYNFREYYDSYVNNIGDTLFGITDMVRNTINNIHKDDFNAILATKPSLESNHFSVVQINKHLDNTDTIENIKKLYYQKSQVKTDLQGVQNSIDRVQGILSTLSFDDTENSRVMYEKQLVELNAKKIDLMNSITSISQEIAENASSTDIPLDGAKYHIRGWVDAYISSLPKVIRVDVEYRYKNKNKYSGNATTIKDSFLFSDWNRQQCFMDMRHPSYNGAKYEYKYDASSDNKNVPSFNQVDVPISQGEIVDIRARYVYDLGWPFIETTSQWSNILSIEFPDEFKKDVSVLNILEENNEDVKSYQFESLLLEKGIPNHVNDSIQDNDILYFHKPEHISSGFYTEERRIIPLKDKLQMIDNSILDLQSEVLAGATSENLIVTLNDKSQSQNLSPFITNQFECIDYSSNEYKAQNKIFSNLINPRDYEVAYSQLDLTFYNAGDYVIKFFTMFPGAYTNILNPSAQSKFTPTDYVFNNTTDPANPTAGVWMMLDDPNNKATLQRFNQFMYFRVNSIYDGTPYYEIPTNTQSIQGSTDKMLATELSIPSKWPTTTDPNINTNGWITIFPYPGDLTAICIESNNMYKSIYPGESLTIPIAVYHYFGTGNADLHLERTFSFDIRTSLYTDPINYTVKLGVGKTSDIYVKAKKDLASAEVSKTPYKSVVVKQVSTQTQSKRQRGSGMIPITNTGKKQR